MPLEGHKRALRAEVGCYLLMNNECETVFILIMHVAARTRLCLPIIMMECGSSGFLFLRSPNLFICTITLRVAPSE